MAEPRAAEGEHVISGVRKAAAEVCLNSQRGPSTALRIPLSMELPNNSELGRITTCLHM